MRAGRLFFGGRELYNSRFLDDARGYPIQNGGSKPPPYQGKGNRPSYGRVPYHVGRGLLPPFILDAVFAITYTA